MYYGFILNMWIMRKIDEVKIETYVASPKNYITQAEADMILVTPQMTVGTSTDASS